MKQSMGSSSFLIWMRGLIRESVASILMVAKEPAPLATANTRSQLKWFVNRTLAQNATRVRMFRHTMFMRSANTAISLIQKRMISVSTRFLGRSAPTSLRRPALQCHVSLLVSPDVTVIAERTHQFNDRLSWRLFGVP